MSIALLLVAFAGALMATYRSLGSGLLAVLVVGYLNGVVRANFPGVFTTFMFDAAVLGLYLGFLTDPSRRSSGVWTATAGRFVLFLIAWPALLSMFPVNHLLVQLVALRATIWFLPTLLIATWLTAADLAVLTRGLAVLNLLALAVGLYIYLYGIEALYPLNPITRMMYASKDIGLHKYHRVPSTFLNAHSYGGTMLFTLPFLLDRLAGVGVKLMDRQLALAGLVASAGGLMLCGARTPLVVLAAALAVTWVLTRFSLTLGLVLAVLIGGGVWVARSNERFQRVGTLDNTDYVSKRVAGSANTSFLELLIGYPAGAGMGSSFGTSVPYFLSDMAPVPIGLENEYSRILVDQGWLGLVGWLGFVGWLCARPPQAQPPRGPWRLGVVFMYSLTLATWGTAFIGTGTLSSVPGSVLLLTQMGVLVAVRTRGVVPGEHNARPDLECPRPEPPAGFHRGPGGCWLPAPTTRSAG